MGRISEKSKADRFLQLRLGNYHYKRHVPKEVADLDDRAPHVRVSLKTSDLAMARAKRDALEIADNEFWASLMHGAQADVAQKRYASAVKRAQALGFTYRSAAEIEFEALPDLAKRLEAILDVRTNANVEQAVLGAIPKPSFKVSEAFKIYVEQIVPDEHMGKSKVQKAQWKKVKQRAVNNFVELVGDKLISDITGDDARKIYKHWMDRIAPKAGRATASPSSGNRDIGNMRVLYAAFFKFMGEPKRENPFDGLSFSDKRKKSRPPFPTAWIKGTILKPGALSSLNSQGRGVILAMIETGARPSELCNLTPEAIRLEDKVPHVKIMPRYDLDDPREIKTASSVRSVPLIGIALEVFKKHPNGFPLYRNRENSMSATLNKHFKVNELFPTVDHKIYSFRHSFKDRMRDAGVDEELRQILMGHAVDSPKYGEGGSMEWRRDELAKIALPFDPSIV